MRATSEYRKTKSVFEGGWGERGRGDGWMAIPKTPKTKKIAQDVHTSERATLRNFFEKKKPKTNTKDFIRLFFGSSEISLFVCLLFK